MFVDVIMPGITGLEVTRRALEISPDLGVITMSGIGEMHTPVEAIRVGSIDYLIKPFEVSEMIECASRALKRKHEAFERKRVQNQVSRWDAAAQALSLSLNVRDKETEGHAERVLEYSKRLGQELNLSNSDMVALEYGARLHDVGKIGVPDHILKKPGKLTTEEWAIMHQHPAIGEQMVLTAQLPTDAATIVGQHHEKWDGSGYPHKLRADQIHIGARVFAVVDAFDAITSNRCYRPGRDYQVALEEIRKFSGTQFDPRVVEAFARIDEAEWHTIRLRCPSDAFPQAQLVA
jgi:response regulator RpfG family c-di-GMP phosphodiesterase